MLKLAQAGLFCTANDSVFPSGSLAVGLKEYAVPATSVVAGVPDIAGGRFAVAAAATVRENAGSDADEIPSLARITIPEVVPTFAADGVPLSVPVLALNAAHAGLAVIANLRVRWRASAAVGVKAYA